MKGRSALPRAAFFVGLIVIAGGLAGSIWGRELLSMSGYFDVRQVEVIGARWVAPDSILRTAAIRSDRSVWDDYTDVERRLAGHPLIEDAQVRRVGMHTLRIVVREVEPIAFVGAPDLRPVRDDGTLLPIDPAGMSLDLPLLTTPAELDEDSARLQGGPALVALEMFAELHSLDPGLSAIISDFGLADDDGLMANLEISQPARSLALPKQIDEMLVNRVRATLAGLRSRGVDAAMVEARYADQIVVRRDQL
jgi:hypothetical protein